MKIDLIVDVSFIASLHERGKPETGIGRVITQVLSRLVANSSLDVSLVGCYGGDSEPIETSRNTQRWASQSLEHSARFCPVRPRPMGRMSWVYSWQRKLRERLNNANQGKKSPVQRIVQSIEYRILGLINRLTSFELDRPDSSNQSVYLALYWPPPQWLPQSLPRVIILYDVYPIMFPGVCDPVLTSMMKMLFSSLNTKRDSVVCISEFTKHEFCKLTKFPQNRVFVAPLAADSRFEPTGDTQKIEAARKRYGIESFPFLLVVANPQPRKNIKVAIQAFYQIAGDALHQDLRLVIAGNANVGWGDDDLPSQIAARPEFSDRVCRIGPVSEADLPVIYSAAFAFLFPSTYEGFGLPVLEAMQCGTPVICSNATSLPEVVGDAAILVDPKSPTEFAEAIRRLINDPNLCRRHARVGQARAAQFSWNRMAAEVLKATQQAART